MRVTSALPRLRFPQTGGGAVVSMAAFTFDRRPMQPKTLALLELFRADQALREAVSHLESITREIRTQENRIAQLRQRLDAAQTRLKEQQARLANLELELKARQEHIEKLRARQQVATNNRDYQALLIEINNAKVDRSKIEEATIKTMEQVEAATVEVQTLTQALQADTAKLAELQARVGDKVAVAQAEVDRLRPIRDAAAAAVEPALLTQFERLAQRFDGEAMAAIDRPNPKEEEYLCTGCSMALVPNVFNQLKARDEVVTCPSCRRILYIPDSLLTPPAPKKSKSKSSRKVVVVQGKEPSSENKWESIVTAAQGESVRDAMEARHDPVECRVEINGEVVGVFKGKSADHLERVIRFRLEESRMSADVRVQPVSAAGTAASPTDGHASSGLAAEGVAQASEAPESPRSAQPG